MAHGPGKYDELATIVLGAAHAEAVLVAVMGGISGSGFSVQFRARDQADARATLLRLAAVLRETAAQVERDAALYPGAS